MATPDTTTTRSGRAQCRYRRCRRWLPRHTGGGRRAEFCNSTCRRHERTQRERELAPPKPPKVKTARPGRRKIQPGDRFGQLALVEYVDPSPGGDSRARWACDCGSTKVLRVGNVTQGLTLDCADRQAHPHPSLVERPLNKTAHNRVRALRGSATDYPCVSCGEPAEHWAYRHSSLDPLADTQGKDTGQPFSTSPGDYLAACRGCHNRFDMAHRALAVPSGQVSGVHHALALAFDPYGDAHRPDVFELDTPDPLLAAFERHRSVESTF